MPARKTDLTMPSDQTREILKKMRQIEIRTSRLATDLLVGPYRSAFPGRGTDFEPVPGDEVRTARAGQPCVKKVVEERVLTLLLAVDVSASGDFAAGGKRKRELAAEIASLLAFTALKNGDRIGMLLFTDQVELFLPPLWQRRHVLRMVREVLGFKAKGRGTDLVQALDFVNDVFVPRAVVFLISDFRATNPRSESIARLRLALRRTNRRHDLVVVSIEEMRESLLPDLGAGATEDAVREPFARVAEGRARRLQRVLNAEAVDSLRLETNRAYLPRLMALVTGRADRRR